MSSALHTKLCDILGIRHPIIQTAMGWIATPELVAASCNAGALGLLATANLRPDEVDAQIQQTKQLTDAPFGVNFLMEAAGILCIPTCGAARHAQKAVQLGADIVIVQGGEGGGHTGTVPTSILVSQVVDLIDAPVVAAGGFKDGRGLVAALAFGASGIAPPSATSRRR
jgi:nitronate monooxygenase